MLKFRMPLVPVKTNPDPMLSVGDVVRIDGTLFHMQKNHTFTVIQIKIDPYWGKQYFLNNNEGLIKTTVWGIVEIGFTRFFIDNGFGL